MSKQCIHKSLHNSITLSSQTSFVTDTFSDVHVGLYQTHWITGLRMTGSIRLSCNQAADGYRYVCARISPKCPPFPHIHLICHADIERLLKSLTYQVMFFSTLPFKPGKILHNGPLYICRAQSNQNSLLFHSTSFLKAKKICSCRNWLNMLELSCR